MAFALQSLVRILEQDEHLHLLSLDNRSKIDSFLEKVRSLRDLVHSTSFALIEDLESRIRDAAYYAEDIIESYIAEELLNPTCGDDDAYELDLTDLIEKFESIREEIIMFDTASRKEQSDLQLVQSLPVVSSSSRVCFSSRDISRLKNQLTGQSSQLQVISIVGTAGSGKTTLSQLLYNLTEIDDHFHCRAGTIISQEFNLRFTLLELLGCLVNITYEMRWKTNDEQLGKYLFANLVSKKYLIVLDDLWHADAWDVLKTFFPNENNGSRIIITTREWNVAEYTKTSIYPHQMLPIDEDTSWEILYQRVFGHGRCCPYDLVETGRKIARNCRGNPLAIVTMAGVLSASDPKQEAWKRVELHQSDSSDVREQVKYIKEDQMSKIQVDPILKGFVDFFAKDGLGFMSQLMHGQSNLQIIPIVGVAESIGKTILSRLLYDRASRGQHFDAHAWVSIEEKESMGTKQRNVLTTLQNLLNSLYKCGMAQVNDVDIGVRLHKTLSNRRYLIVVDDIRDADTWDNMSRFFPDEDNGSRIILTAREWSYYDDDEIKPFHLDSYWEFLLGKVVRLLPTLEKKLEFWKLVEEEHVSSKEDKRELNSDLLSMSYNHLPYHLKPCFLYLGAFPEDSEIQSSRIIQLWIAEGFVRSVADNSLENTALMYLESLISRNLLYTCNKDLTGKPISFKIHDVFWKFCRKKAFDEKFMCFKDLNDQNIPEEEEDVRRVSMHHMYRHSNDDEEVFSLARTLLCIGPASLDLAPTFWVLRLMRVLDVLGLEFDDFPEEMLKLVNLRYIAFTCHSALPSSISIFRNLQTLITSKVLSLPSELWELTKITHIDCEGTSVWSIPGNGERFLHEELQTLINIPASEVTLEFLRHSSNIKKLGIIFNASNHAFLELDLLEKLEDLNCSSVLSKRQHDFLPYLRLPASLRKLVLTSCIIRSEFMTTHVALLSFLETLCLGNCDLVNLLWEPTEGGFLQLRYLMMEDLNLVHWRANSTHFPKLRCLDIRACHTMEEIPIDVGDIPTLEQIYVDEKCSPSVLASARRIQVKQANLGNDLLRFIFHNGVVHQKPSMATDIAESSTESELAMQKPETSPGEELDIEYQNSNVMADEAEAKGQMAFSNGNFVDAIRHYTDAINLNPMDHFIYSSRSRAYVSLNQFSEALIDAQKIVHLKPDLSEGYSQVGDAYMGLGNLEGAISAYTKGLQTDPNNDILKSRLSNAKGNAAVSADNFIEAVQHYTDNLSPSNHIRYFNRSIALAHLSQFSGALSDAQMIVELKPMWTGGYSRLGAAYLGLQNYKDAISAYKKGLQIDPNDDYLKSGLCEAKGKAAFSAGNYIDAIRYYTNAINLDPLNHHMYSYRSQAHVCLRQFSKAMFDAQVTVCLNPHYSLGYACIGDVYFGLHIYMDAVSAYMSGLVIDPSSDELKFRLRNAEAALAMRNRKLIRRNRKRKLKERDE